MAASGHFELVISNISGVRYNVLTSGASFWTIFTMTNPLAWLRLMWDIILTFKSKMAAKNGRQNRSNCIKRPITPIWYTKLKILLLWCDPLVIQDKLQFSWWLFVTKNPRWRPKWPPKWWKSSTFYQKRSKNYDKFNK